MPDDEIRLTLPTDADLAPVVVAAVGAAVKAAGVGPDGVARVRREAQQAVDEVLARGTGSTMDLTVRAERRGGGGYRLFFELVTEGWTATVTRKSGG